MDRAVIVDADLSDAILVRAIFTRSDFGRSTIAGADFSAALVDKDQQVGVYQSFYYLLELVSYIYAPRGACPP